MDSIRSFVNADWRSCLQGSEQVFRKMAVPVKTNILEDSELFTKLRMLRRNLAETQGVPPFVIFSDKTLRSMCALLPKTLSEMAEVKGVGSQKLEKYGQQFIDVIQADEGVLSQVAEK